MAKRDQNNGHGFLIGAVIGAVASLLLAPRTGKETREQLLGGRFDPDKQDNRWHKAADASSASTAGGAQDLRKKIDEARERLRRQAGVGDDE